MTGPVIAALEVSMTGVFMTFFLIRGGGVGYNGGFSSTRVCRG